MEREVARPRTPQGVVPRRLELPDAPAALVPEHEGVRAKGSPSGPVRRISSTARRRGEMGTRRAVSVFVFSARREIVWKTLRASTTMSRQRSESSSPRRHPASSAAMMSD